LQRKDCSAVLKAAYARGWNRVALIGVSDLAEIATICALEQGITVVAVAGSEESENNGRRPLCARLFAICLPIRCVGASTTA
jgi:D-arabinose 1-dehydrogenase-like Zn-dependent alcohol dehydrogenase